MVDGLFEQTLYENFMQICYHIWKQLIYISLASDTS